MYIYIYMQSSIYIYIHASINIYIYIHTSICIYIYICKYIYIYCDGKLSKIPKRDFIFARVKTGQVGT